MPKPATWMIGFIALAGIIVRNSILLVGFPRHAVAEGKKENVMSQTYKIHRAKSFRADIGGRVMAVILVVA